MYSYFYFSAIQKIFGMKGQAALRYFFLQRCLQGKKMSKKPETAPTESKKTKRRKKKKHRSKVGTAILTVFLSLFMIGVVTAGSIMYTVLSDIGLISLGDLDHSEDVAGIDYIDLDNYLNNQQKTTIIYAYDEDGNLFEETRLHGTENRTPVALKDISHYVKDAVIALEDKRFYDHKGVDWIRTFGVMIKDLRGNDAQGGSTLTQQLIKNLTGENTVTLIRKYNEIKNALSLERHFQKDEILEAYLNTIYLDNGCYGVKTGAEFYFGKSVKELSLMESVILVSITNAPRKFDPLVNFDNNHNRAVMCLNYMLEQNMITQEEYDDALAEDVKFVGKMADTNNEDEDTGEEELTYRDMMQGEESEYQSYYTDYIIDRTIADLRAKYNYTSEEAWRKVYLGGLRIYSAVDVNIQKTMEYVYTNRVTLPMEEDGDDSLQSSMVVMDFTGRVLGMVGQLGHKSGNRVQNYAVSDPRQPGSSIKPLSAYSPAIDSGTLYWSSYFPNYGILGVNGSKPWPTNYGGVAGSPNDYKNFPEAIAPSLNTIPARIVQALGVDYCYSYLRDKYHMSTLAKEDDDYPALAIGAMYYGTTTLDMTAAYVPFCNGGTYFVPAVYYKVEDSNGKVILERDTVGEQVLNPGTADVMIHLLRNVVTASNGTGNPYPISNQFTFSKSGTTSDLKDKWFVGGSAYYVGATWSGFKYRKTINTGYYGSNPSAKLWKAVMDRIHEGLPYKDFEYTGDAVQRTYCRVSGNLASSICGATGVGWFRADALPPRCTTHAGFGGVKGGSSSSTTNSSTEATSKTDGTTGATNATTTDTNTSSRAETSTAEPTPPGTSATVVPTVTDPTTPTIAPSTNPPTQGAQQEEDED